MIVNLTFHSLEEGRPKETGEFIVILHGEMFRAMWTGLCWTSKGRGNFIAPDWWAKPPEDTKVMR